MDLIDAAGDTPGAEDDEEDDDELAAQRPGVGPPKAESGQEPAPRSQGQGPGTGSGDTYRPKRPTTLNLFPQVPRSQVRREKPRAELRGRRPGWTGKMEGRKPVGETRDPGAPCLGEGRVFCRRARGRALTRGSVKSVLRRAEASCPGIEPGEGGRGWQGFEWRD